METVTLCGCVVSISEKSDNSQGQMQNTVWFSSHKRRIYYYLVAAFHYINLFVSSQKKFAMVIGMLHGMKVKCDVLLQKQKHDLWHVILFLSLTLVTGVL